MTELLPLTTAPLPVRLRAADYLMLDDSGALEPYGKTELLDGEIVYMNAQHRPHALLKMAMYEAIREALRDVDSPLTLMVEASVALSDHDTPEPDLTLTSEPDGHGLVPGPSVALIVEIADASLQSDMSRKAAIYARAGVPEYWVADLNGRAVHQMSAPIGDRYTKTAATSFGDPVSAHTLIGLSIRTDRL